MKIKFTVAFTSQNFTNLTTLKGVRIMIINIEMKIYRKAVNIHRYCVNCELCSKKEEEEEEETNTILFINVSYQRSSNFHALKLFENFNVFLKCLRKSPLSHQPPSISLLINSVFMHSSILIRETIY